jgi:hypothetical protein
MLNTVREAWKGRIFRRLINAQIVQRNEYIRDKADPRFGEEEDQAFFDYEISHMTDELERYGFERSYKKYRWWQTM